VQAIEGRLGIKVFDRNTRTVTITEPGAVLLRETEAIPNILSGAMRRIREDYLGARREIRIGISRDLALAHIPGIFHTQQNIQPEVRIIVSQPDEAVLLEQVANAGLDLGIVSQPSELPKTVAVTHRMEDHFSVLVSATAAPPTDATPNQFRRWAESQNWLLPPGNSRSRQLIDDWANDRKLKLNPIMELEGFDLMIQLTSMQMGAAFIPRRALSTFPRKGLVQLIHLPVALSRQLIVISPHHARSSEHVSRFVEGILFS
jgi:DNA-binding transcriptional LysR family regulator